MPPLEKCGHIEILSPFSEKGDQLQKRDIIFFFLIFGAVFFFLTYNISSYYTQF